MSFKTIMVHVDDDKQAASRVRFAAALAKTHAARLIGVSAYTIPPPTVGAAGFTVTVPIGEELSQTVTAQLRKFEANFRKRTSTVGDVEWRAAIDIPTSFLVETARAADLVIAESPETADTSSVFRRVDIGDLIMRVGRPVLVPAAGSTRLDAKTVFVAWHDSREARRGIRDALPLMAKSAKVVVATVDDRKSKAVRDGLADVAAYLGRHGVKAETRILSGSAPEALIEASKRVGAGLIVSGGYGHSRLREWAFGGVTRTLLNHHSVSRLLSN